MSKLAKIKVLENWYIIDSILFNGHAKKFIKEAKDFEQYITLKGAFLSTIYEYYCHIKYVPSYGDSVPVSTKQLCESAKTSAVYARKLAANIIHKEAVKESLKKKIIREAAKKNIKNMDKFSETVVHESFIKLSLDNALVGLALLEAADRAKKDDFSGSIFYESYKMYRDSLIHLSRTCTRK